MLRDRRQGEARAADEAYRRRGQFLLDLDVAEQPAGADEAEPLLRSIARMSDAAVTVIIDSALCAWMAITCHHFQSLRRVYQEHRSATPTGFGPSGCRNNILDRKYAIGSLNSYANMERRILSRRFNF